MDFVLSWVCTVIDNNNNNNNNNSNRSWETSKYGKNRSDTFTCCAICATALFLLHFEII